MYLAGRNNEMAHSVDISMISPPTSSSISTDQDPFGQLPPLLPPLRSTQVLKPLTGFPGGLRFFKEEKQKSFISFCDFV